MYPATCHRSKGFSPSVLPQIHSAKPGVPLTASSAMIPVLTNIGKKRLSKKTTL